MKVNTSKSMKAFFIGVVYLILLSCQQVFASDVIKVKVNDELGKPIPGLKVRVHTYPVFVSDAYGMYDLNVNETLEMPFEVFVESKQYEIIKFSYYKEDHQLTVNVKLKNTKPLKITPVIKEAQVVVDKRVLSPVIVKDSLIEEVNESVAFSKYKEDFQAITHEIYLERARLTENNEKIREEISRITIRLEGEKGLTQEERIKLRAYLKKLEFEFSENAKAFRKAEEKTQVLIEKLKDMLVEKDSINAVTSKKLVDEKLKRVVAEQKNKRSFIIFSIISFYAIARKMRRHRTQLMKSNQEMVESKEKLEESIVLLNQQKAMIEEKNKQLDTFAYKASHDIKGPLKSIKGLTDVGLKTAQEKASVELFEYIYKSADKLDNLVTDMLSFAKDSKSELQLVDVSVRTMVEEILSDLSSVEGSKDLQVEVMLPKDLSIKTDERLLYSTVQNLIENAIKYADRSKPKQTLTISSERLLNSIKLNFQDNGEGIAPAYHEKIFTSFFRNSSISNGTGLGLYIVKQNVEKLGGVITVQSKVGEGSLFVLELPLT
jgi:signal transduction histidine kinase